MDFRTIVIFAIVLNVVYCARRGDDEEDEDPYTSTDPAKREPTPCEICKYFITELKTRLEKSARSKEVIQIGQGIDPKKKKSFKYLTSELRLTEALHEPHICENILNYNVHAERKGSNRYAKGQSETMSTLHGLVNKGVKVELGIPYELWNSPSAEVTKMHRACFALAEAHEDDIEEWYYNHQDKDLMKYLCEDRYLRGKKWDPKCLEEYYKPKDEKDDEQDDAEKAGGDDEDKEDTDKKPDKRSKKGDTGKKKDEL